ncbi:MAG: hypothetical protein ACREV1_10585 [Gammaproteobacteria bacterium]
MYKLYLSFFALAVLTGCARAYDGSVTKDSPYPPVQYPPANSKQPGTTAPENEVFDVIDPDQGFEECVEGSSGEARTCEIFRDLFRTQNITEIEVIESIRPDNTRCCVTRRREGRWHQRCRNFDGSCPPRWHERI